MFNKILLLPCFFFIFSCSQVEVQTSLPIKQQRYTTAVVKAAALSNDGAYAVIADNSQVCVWNNATNKKALPCISGQEAEFIELVGISGNNKVFFTSNQIITRLYQRSNGQKIHEWSAGENIINDIAISDNGQLMLLGYRSGQAGIFNVLNNKLSTFTNHRLDINAVALSADGQLALTGSSDKTAVLWQSQTGEKIQTFDHRTRVNHVDMNSDGTLGFTLDSVNDRRIWQLKTHTELSELQTSIKFIEVNSSTFSADNQLMLSGSPKQKIQLWQTKDGELIGEWLSFKDPSRTRSSVLATAFLANNKIATISSDGMYELFEFTLPKQ